MLLRKIHNRYLLYKCGSAVYAPNINLQNQALFIHVPKNAGTSVCRSLGMEQTNHNTLAWYQQNLKQGTYQKLFKFAFVRDPYSRFLSLYKYARMEESFYHSSTYPNKAIYGKHMDYDKLLDASPYECAVLLVEGKLEHDSYNNHWQPQTNWLVDQNGDSVDFLGRFEEIEKSYETIRSRIGGTHLEKLNSSIGESAKNVLDPKTKELLRSFYKEDFERFGYRA